MQDPIKRKEDYQDIVMAGLVPAIHAFRTFETWMSGIKPGMRGGEITPTSL